MEKCPQCNTFTVSNDDHYSQEQKVCTNCGMVVAEGSYQNDNPSHVPNPTVVEPMPVYIKREKLVATTQGKIAGTKKLGVLASKFSIPFRIKSGVLESFTMALQNPKFLNLKIEKKEALVVCFLYINLRQNNWPVTIASLCEEGQVPLTLFNEMLSAALAEYPTSIRTSSLEELVPLHLKCARLSDKDAIVGKVLKVIELMRKVWLSYGRKPEGIISAATFLVWSSLDISQRAKTTYKQFCRASNLPEVSTAAQRLKEIFSMLQKLTLKLPWIQKESVDKKEVLYSLDKVLMYSRSLLFDLSSETDDDALNAEPAYPFVNIRKRKLAAAETVPDVPCKVMVSVSPELTEDDIPSSEMHHYLRSPTEILELQKILDD